MGGTLKDLAAVDGAMSQPSPSPDGSRVAFIASLNGRPVRSYSQPDLFIVDRADVWWPTSPSGTTTTSATGSRRPARASRQQFHPAGLDGRRQGDRQVAAAEGRDLLRIDAASGEIGAIIGRPRSPGIHDDQGRRAALLSSSPTRLCGSSCGRRSTGAFRDDRGSQRGALRNARPARAEVFWTLVRRHARTGLDSQASGVRSLDPVPGDPADPRRAPRRVRGNVHARVLCGWPPAGTSSSTRTRAAARPTGSSSATSSSTTTPATTIAT